MFKFLATFFLILLLSFSFSLPSFVAVGTGGIIASSDDGASWVASSNSQSVFDNNIIRGIAFNGSNKFVAVGLGFHVASSSDGNVWVRNSDSVSSGYSIAYGNGKFVMGSSDDRIYISTDGNTWVASSNALDVFGIASPVYSVAYDGVGTWVAVGGASGGSKVMYSTDDGDTWTASEGYNFDNNTPIYSVVYNSDISTWMATGGGGKSAYSSDGTSWTKINPVLNIMGTANASGGRGVTSGLGLFVEVGATGRSAYSSNGTSWTRSANDTTIFGTTPILWTTCYSPNTYSFVAGGTYGKMGYSYNGSTWYASTGDSNSQVIFGSGIADIVYSVIAPVVSYTPDACSPAYDEDWVVSELTECTDATIDIGTGILYLNVVGKLVLTNSNVTASSLVLIDSGVEIWLSSGSWLKVG